MKQQLHCCKIGCKAPPQWIIYQVPSPEPYELRHACTAHVGDMLTDAPEHHIFPIDRPQP